MKPLHSLVLAAALALAPAAVARADESTSPVQVRGSFFALQVADVEASVAWWRDVFGLSLAMSPPTRNGVTMRLMEGDGLMVELIQDDSARPLRDLIPGGRERQGPIWVHGVFKGGIIVDDFDGVIARLRERGADIAIGPFPATREQRANAVIRDNEGNYIQVVSSQPPVS
ncbi:VOC family protein [Brevundimonas sp. 2R-24]|uniref:VOC family protein n=1 Tax=Peiella sedimenti TaxID=3061083 RepID=A0ABT8SNS8_9CAUL|nr:VOC family protein [Caulobacteraceae bacterium XZ-24]